MKVITICEGTRTLVPLTSLEKEGGEEGGRGGRKGGRRGGRRRGRKGGREARRGRRGRGGREVNKMRYRLSSKPHEKSDLLLSHFTHRPQQTHLGGCTSSGLL